MMQGRRTTFVLGLTLLTACGSKPGAERPIGNSGGVSEPAIALDPDTQPLGALGLATAPARTDATPYWVPFTDAAPVMVPPPADVKAGTAYTVVAASGDPQKLTAGEQVTVPYGCDNNSTEMIPLTGGAAMAPGLVWVLPPEPPVRWAPHPVALVAGENTAARRTWTAGNVELALTRTDDSHAAFTLTDHGRELLKETYEVSVMDGADVLPLDLSKGRTPGIPLPEAVFAIGNGDLDPYLLVLDESGYEGVGFGTLLVRPADDSVRKVDALQIGLYYCAF